jgi:hypothetical protein
MASSSTEICNLALSHLAQGQEIANLDTEKSDAAAACRRFYEIARDEMLRAFHWPFATKFAFLGLVEELDVDSAGGSEWRYSYRYPVDCLKLRRILSGSRNDNRQSRVPYKIARDENGSLIYSDLEEAEVEYTVKVTEVIYFQPDFVMALSLLLAAYIAPRLTNGDPFRLGNRAVELHKMAYMHASANAVGEEQQEELPESEFIRARD